MLFRFSVAWILRTRKFASSVLVYILHTNMIQNVINNTHMYIYIHTYIYTGIYEGKYLNNRNFIIIFLQEYLQKLFVSYFSTWSPCFATHLVHLSTSLRMPSRKKLDLLFHCLTYHANWSPTPVFTTDILSSVLKSFHPFIHSPLTQTTVAIPNLHSSVDFRRFHTL